MLQIIDAKPYAGPDKAKEIAGFLLDKFQKAYTARQTQVDGNYKRWLDNYSAKPYESVRTTPWYRASNFIPQLIRMHVDILTARMTTTIFGTKPFWKPTSVMDMVPQKYLQALGTWMEFETFNRMDFFNPVHSGIFRTFKTGTNTFKCVWKDLALNSYQVVVGAGTEGEAGPAFKTIQKEGNELIPIPFEDFTVYPFTVGSLKQVQIKFHTLRFDKEMIEFRAAKGIWDKEAAQELLRQGESKPVVARESQSQEAGLTLNRDTILPFNAIECWVKYTFQDGNVYPMCVVLNPQSTPDKAVLRMYFNPDARGEDPFIDQRVAPREDLYWGYSIPEILEQVQEENAQIHNHRRDANTIANMPMWKKKRGADVPNPSNEAYPGKVFELENMDDMEALITGVNYNSMIEEEAFNLELSSKYTGIGPAMQAMGSGILDGKRGVYSAQGTMAMLQQGSDRPDLYLALFREPFHCLGLKMARNWKNYGSTIPFQLWGETGQLLQEIFSFPEPDSYDPVFFTLGASDGSANREVDRTNLLLMSNTMAGYYQQIFQAVGTVAQLPPDSPIREVLLRILDGAKDLTDRLLYVFNIGDRKSLVPDVREILGGGPGGTGNLPTDERGADSAGLPSPAAPVPVSGLEELSRAIGALPR